MSSTKSDTRIKILNATWQLMEQGGGLSMSNIAKQAQVSRQALYLHFDSRTELMIATLGYVDDEKLLAESLKPFHSAKSGIEMLEAYVEVWGRHIPEIFGLAKAMIKTKEADEASAAAWNERMMHLHGYCKQIVDALKKDGVLAKQWSKKEAIEILWTMTSVQNWEQFTVECGWSTNQYIKRMKILLKQTLLDTP